VPKKAYSRPNCPSLRKHFANPGSFPLDMDGGMMYDRLRYYRTGQ